MLHREYHKDPSLVQYYFLCTYINDIGLNIYRLFADDITPDDHVHLQEDLNTLIKWANDWKMMFNISKCKIMQFTTHRNKSKFTYIMSNTPLENAEEHDYLGVRLNQKFSWSSHINNACNEVNRMLGFL